MEDYRSVPRFTLVFLLLGALLIGLGVFGLRYASFSEPVQVEILGEADRVGETQDKLVVEAAGAVRQPGVFSLPANSRVADLLIQAGGLAAVADREWVSKNLNLAQILTDGVKIYIPSTDPQTTGLNTANEININTASQVELDQLWGVGPATAQKIIAGRPYQKIEELLTKKIVKSNVWEAIKEQITVY